MAKQSFFLLLLHFPFTTSLYTHFLLLLTSFLSQKSTSPTDFSFFPMIFARRKINTDDEAAKEEKRRKIDHLASTAEVHFSLSLPGISTNFRLKIFSKNTLRRTSQELRALIKPAFFVCPPPPSVLQGKSISCGKSLFPWQQHSPRKKKGLTLSFHFTLPPLTGDHRLMSDYNSVWDFMLKQLMILLCTCSGFLKNRIFEN